jgi:hypothetical protein
MSYSFPDSPEDGDTVTLDNGAVYYYDSSTNSWNSSGSGSSSGGGGGGSTDQFIKKTGGTMEGYLSLDKEPEEDDHAVTKKYVEKLRLVVGSSPPDQSEDDAGGELWFDTSKDVMGLFVWDKLSDAYISVASPPWLDHNIQELKMEIVESRKVALDLSKRLDALERNKV